MLITPPGYLIKQKVVGTHPTPPAPFIAPQVEHVCPPLKCPCDLVTTLFFVLRYILCIISFVFIFIIFVFIFIHIFTYIMHILI